jgi:hypothetical protein
MHIHIFDHGIASKSGHHFDFCRSIANDFVQKGFTVSVWGPHCARDFVDAEFTKIGCTFSRLFSHFCYAQPIDEQPQLAQLEAIARQAAAEMSSVPRADLCIFPSLTAEHLWAFSLSNHASPMLGMAHTEPTYQHATSAQVWSMASKLVQQRNLPVTLAAIDPVIGNYLQTYLNGLPVAVPPVPIGGAQRQHYSTSLRTIGFFGHQRVERGIAIIPALCDRLLSLGYRVVLHDTRGQFNSSVDNPHLHLLRSFIDDLYGEIANCDLVVCPMDRYRYSRRLSGIACSAVASGVPLVLASGTLSAVRFQDLGSSACYIEGSVEYILEAIGKIALDYPGYAAAARRGAQIWNQQQGVGRFVDYAIGVIGQGSGVASAPTHLHTHTLTKVSALS